MDKPKNTLKKGQQEPGIEYPPDYNQNQEQPEVTADPPVQPVAVEPAQPAETKLVRSQVSTWQQALKALPTKFSELQVESKRATIELGFALQIIQNNDALQKCDPKSIYDAVIYSARMGITLNPASGLAYLVPRKGKCCLDVGYKGWRACLVSYGAIKHIDGYVVYADEQFDWRPDLNELTHVPKDVETEAEQKERKVRGAYARAVLPDGLVVFEFIPNWELQKIKGVSAAASKGFSPYTEWEAEMIRKAPIKRLAKKLQVLQDDDRVRAMFENEKANDEAGKAQTASRWTIDTEAQEVG